MQLNKGTAHMVIHRTTSSWHFTYVRCVSLLFAANQSPIIAAPASAMAFDEMLRESVGRVSMCNTAS